MIGKIRNEHQMHMLRHDHPCGQLKHGSLPRPGDVLDEGFLDRIIIEQRQTLEAGRGQEPNVAAPFKSTTGFTVQLHKTMILRMGATASNQRESAVREATMTS